MTSTPEAPSVLDATILSNVAYVDRVDVLEVLPRICTVPEVRRELEAGAEAYPYLERALAELGDAIPVVDPSERVETLAAERETQLDAGEAEAFSVAAVHDGTLMTDDGPARTLARDEDVPVTGSIGVLIRAVEENRVSLETADRWLTVWIDETDYRAPSSELADYF